MVKTLACGCYMTAAAYSRNLLTPEKIDGGCFDHVAPLLLARMDAPHQLAVKLRRTLYALDKIPHGTMRLKKLPCAFFAEC